MVHDARVELSAGGGDQGGWRGEKWPGACECVRSPVTVDSGGGGLG